MTVRTLDADALREWPLPALAQEFLGRMADGRAVDRVRVGLDERGEFRIDMD